MYVRDAEYTERISAEEKGSLNECLGYDTKHSDGEAPVTLELWGMQNTPSMTSLPCPLWPRVVTPDRALSMGQIELNYVLMLNWVVWNRTVFENETVNLWKTELFERELFWNLSVCKQNKKCTYTKLICLK